MRKKRVEGKKYAYSVRLNFERGINLCEKVQREQWTVHDLINLIFCSCVGPISWVGHYSKHLAKCLTPRNKLTLSASLYIPVFRFVRILWAY
jgi:hypothetical protein